MEAVMAVTSEADRAKAVKAMHEARLVIEATRLDKQSQANMLLSMAVNSVVDAYPKEKAIDMFMAAIRAAYILREMEGETCSG